MDIVLTFSGILTTLIVAFGVMVVLIPCLFFSALGADERLAGILGFLFATALVVFLISLLLLIISVVGGWITG